MSESLLKGIFSGIGEHFRRYIVGYIVLTVIFIVGLVVGLKMPQMLDSENSQELSGFLSSMLKQLPTAEIDGHLEMMRAFFLNGLLLAVIWFLGVTIIGAPVVTGVLFYKGFCLGTAISFLLTVDNVQGTIMVLLTVLPQNLFLIPIFIIASMLSIGLSVALVKNNYGGRSGLWKSFLRYSGYFVLLLAGVFFCAYIQGYFDPWLIKMLFKIS